MRGFLIALLTVQQVHATATCFLEETSTTPYVALSVSIEASIRWCYTACDETAGCTSVVFDEVDGSCVKMSDDPVPPPNTCHAPYQRHYMSDAGCPYPNSMTAMGTDPCSRLMPFLLEYESNKLCPQRACDGSEGPPIVVRYRNATGALLTLDNASNNILSFDAVTMKWGVFYKDRYGFSTTYATAIACAEIINPSACPCDTLPVYNESTAYIPRGPMIVESVPACPAQYPVVINKNAKTLTRTIQDPANFKATCIGGAWMACSPPNNNNYAAMAFGGCGTPPTTTTSTTTVTP